jgi:hypothetical protein
MNDYGAHFCVVKLLLVEILSNKEGSSRFTIDSKDKAAVFLSVAVAGVIAVTSDAG